MVANRFFENVVKFRCSGTTTVNQNCNQEEIKSSLLSLGVLAVIWLQPICSLTVSEWKCYNNCDRSSVWV